MNKHCFYVFAGLACLAWLAAACAGAPVTPTATAPPAKPSATAVPPTDTPAPTATPSPVPTDTPEPTASPTPTVDRAATAQAEATQASEAALAEIGKELETVGLSTDSGHLLWSQDEPVEISLDSYDEAVYDPFGDNRNASDFVLKSEVTWESTSGLAICGFFFRSEKNFEEGKQYSYRMLRLSGLPAWAISFFQYGEVQKDISYIRTNSAIKQEQGSTNKVVIIAEGEKFTVYINDIRAGSFYDYGKSMLDGYFAFLALQESGETTCTFDKTWVWALQ
jgi:hypothetical protein